MAKIIEQMGYVAMVVAWICGTVLAPGWLKVCAFLFPPYAWYLVAELAMRLAGLIGGPCDV